jgi:hypothetical protein
MARLVFLTLLGLAATLVAGCSDDSPPSPRLEVGRSAINTQVSPIEAFHGFDLGMTVVNRPKRELWTQVEHTSAGIEAVTLYVFERDPNYPDEPFGSLSISFKAPNIIGPGTYADTVTLHVCDDAACTKEIKGSPVTIPVTLVVETPQPLAAEPLPLTGQAFLGHNVIDAEFSDALDSIVMVSNSTGPALHVYDPSTGTEQSLVLDKAPTSVALSGDGLTAAVSHDALITLVDLARLDDVIVSPKTLLDVSADLSDVVLGDNGYVYGLPRVDQHVKIHSVHIATNTETLSTTFIYEGVRAKLHPSGTKVYAVNTRSTANMARYSIDGAAQVAYGASTFNPDECDNLWMPESGVRIYTACGAVFRSSDVRSHDMVYAGTLELTESFFWEPLIKSLSKASQRDEVAVLDESFIACDVLVGAWTCFTYFGVYDSAYLALQSRYHLAPVVVAGTAYAQRGLFVFHSADGTTRYLISRLPKITNPDQEYAIATVDLPGPSADDPEPPPPPVINASIEPGLAAAPLVEVAAVPHDIVDAEFSAALNAIVMVSSYPENALYVHDLATRTERVIALTREPTAVSVGPDGMHAAVGHIGLVTIADLAVAGAAEPILLTTVAAVQDVVLAGNGWVYAFPSGPSPRQLSSLHIATGAETLSTAAWSFDDFRAVLNLAGTALYAANTGSTPDNVSRFPLGVGPAQYGYSAPYHGVHNVCGNVWLAENGSRLYSRCGATFSQSETQAEDLLYAGSLALYAPNGYNEGYLIESLSDSAEAQQVALIEFGGYCQSYPDTCRSHVNLYSNASLTLATRYSLTPFTVSGTTYAQWGMFAFHSADGSKRYVVSRLYGMLNPQAEFYISRLP